MHIGPHKTGTTALQHCLAAARPALARQGVIYPGADAQHRLGALAVTSSRGMSGSRRAVLRDWDRLVADVGAVSSNRVVVSAEVFDEADDAVVRKVVNELGGERVQVVMTLRPLAKILPSAWQQMIKNRLRLTYPEWLEIVLDAGSDHEVAQKFWGRHRHEELLDRWMSAVGPDRMAVVVVSDSDRTALPRAFEELLGVNQGTLQATEVRDNRGLTAAEIELVRQLNIAFRRRNWSPDLYHRIVHLGCVLPMQTRTPAPEEPRIETPPDVVARANEIAATAAADIRASGVRVVGDLGTLSSVVPTPSTTPPGSDQGLVMSAAELATGGAAEQIATLLAARHELLPVDQVGSAALLGVVVARARRRLAARRGGEAVVG